MNYHGRLLLNMAIDKESYSKKNERYAEQLSHVKDHVLLETHLRLLDELDEETHSETADEERSDEESSVELRQSVLIHQYLEDSQKEIAEGFVKLGRMLWLCLSPELEDESPRKTCNISVNL